MSILPSKLYKEICWFVEVNHNYEDLYCLQELFNKYPHIQRATLGSIYNQFISKKVRQAKGNLEANRQEILKEWEMTRKKEQPKLLLLMAQKYRVSPLRIAELIVQKKFNSIEHRSVAEQMKDPILIKDPQLSYEVYQALIYDLSFNRTSPIIKRLIGEEYERKLETCLTENGISFKTESDLRSLNYNRTPDILLDVPIAVDNHVIKWIESKALFADEKCHLRYIQIQYQHYYTYGAGMVIYWFGCTDSVKSEHKKNKVLVMEEFPKDIVKIRIS